MSLEFPVPDKRPIVELVKLFLSEANTILDDGEPLTKRAAMLFKWCIVMNSVTRSREECKYLLDHDQIVELTRRLLEKVSVLVRTEA